MHPAPDPTSVDHNEHSQVSATHVEIHCQDGQEEEDEDDRAPIIRY